MIKARAHNFGIISSITVTGAWKEMERESWQGRLSYGMRLSSLGDHGEEMKSFSIHIHTPKGHNFPLLDCVSIFIHLPR